MCCLSISYIFTDVSLDANLEDDIDDVTLLKDVIEAAEDREDVHHELADALALVPPSQLEGHESRVNVVEAENGEDVAIEEIKEVENLDVHHPSRGLES